MSTRTDQGVILIVDDILTNLEVLFDCLTSAGFRILVAEDGESAIQKAKYAVPDLILLDVLMPGLDGFETCRRLKADATTAGIPIIFMTALTETVDKVKGFSLGAVDYVTKPFQQEEVLARVQTHVHLQHLARQLQAQNQRLEQEIQERQRSEVALRESEERFHLAFENAAIGMALVSPKGVWLQVNRALCEMLGYSEEELLATTFHAVTHPDDIGIGRSQLQQLIRGNKRSVQFEKRYRHKQGYTVWVLLSASLVQDLQGQPLYAVTQIENITERKRAQEELQQQHLRAQLFAEVTLKIRQSLQLEDIFQTAVTEIQRILKADRVLLFQLWSDGSGQVVQEAVVPEYPATLTQTFQDSCFQESYLDQYRQGRMSAIANIEDAEIQPCYVEFLQRLKVKANLVVPIVVRESLWGLLIAHQCAHPRHWTSFETELLQQLANQIGIALAQAQLLEQETHQRQELSRSNSDLQQFAYIASHDLQEPLRMISSYLQLLERRYKDRLDTDAIEFIAYAVDGAIRMKTLINDLLVYSRLGTQTKPFKLTDCNQVVQQAIANLRMAIQENQVQMILGDLPTIPADATQLNQLFQNLISNAIKFRGTTAPKIEIAADHQAEGWRFWVRDNGIGIDAEYAERIFIIFQRLHSRSSYPGTGIGLAICKKIVERHGGQIWVESTVGQGSTFYFTVPDQHTSYGRLMQQATGDVSRLPIDFPGDWSSLEEL